MLECSRADTGVGPSMAEISHGWNINWADLLAAATTRLRSRVVGVLNENR